MDREAHNCGNLFQFGDFFISPDKKVLVESNSALQNLFLEAEENTKRKETTSVFDFFDELGIVEYQSQGADLQGFSTSRIILASESTNETGLQVEYTNYRQADAEGAKNAESAKMAEAFLWHFDLFRPDFTPKYSFSVEYYLDSLKHCSCFAELTDDIQDALIYNLKYTYRKKRPIWSKARETRLQTKYDTLSDPNYFFMPFSMDDIRHDFCDYSISALFFQDFHTNNVPEASGRCFKFVDNKRDFKGRTFRKMLFWLGLDSSKAGIIRPRIEDRWYLEKVTGFRTAVALFPIATMESGPWGNGLDLAIKLSSDVMKCKPLKSRICIANTTADIVLRIAADSLNGSGEFWRVQLDRLKEQLVSTIEEINEKYQFSIAYLYDMLLKNNEWRDELLNKQIYNNETLLYRKCADYGLSLRERIALLAIYLPDRMDEIFSLFRNPASNAKRLQATDRSMQFQKLQSEIMRGALESYGLTLHVG